MPSLPALGLPCLLALAACTTTPAATAGDAAVSGAIRIGTQAIPAMRGSSHAIATALPRWRTPGRWSD